MNMCDSHAEGKLFGTPAYQESRRLAYDHEKVPQDKNLNLFLD